MDISLELEPDLSAYDLVHLTNVTRIQGNHVQMQNAKNKVKVALSTIFGQWKTLKTSTDWR